MNTAQRLQLFTAYKDHVMNDNADHDPLPRELPGESHFALMGRDPLAPGFARLYAIVRENGPDCDAKARAMLESVLLANRGRAPKPHKDKHHAWSARAVTDQMQEWYRLNMAARPQSGKLHPYPLNAHRS